METLYQLSPAVRWNVSLRSVLGHLVWDLGCYPAGNLNVVPESGYWINEYARGMVDVQSGALIRFSRPTKVKIDSQIIHPVPAKM